MFHIPENSLLATASLANKPVNEDSCVEIVNETAGFNAIIVADGLGSYGYADQASAFAVNWMKNKLMQLDDVQAIDFQEFFPLLKHALRRYVDEFELDNETVLDRFQNFGTTVICAVETAEEYIFGYVGNGAIWHIKANFNEFSAARLIPWNAVNYLNPHTVEEGGREALYKLLSPSDNFDEITPTVLKVSKDKFSGDMIMVCTDGVYSQDQLRIGKNTTGIWMKIEESMLDFYTGLNNYFEILYKPELAEIENEELLKLENNIDLEDKSHDEKNAITETELLKEFLTSYLQNGTWDDDATIGVLITKEALQYQREKY